MSENTLATITSHLTPTVIARGFSTTIGAVMLLSLSSCYEKNDPSYEKEVLKLTAENAVLETKLEAADKKIKEVSSELSSLRAKVTNHQQKSSDETMAKLKKLEASLVKRDSALLKLTQEMEALKKQSVAKNTSAPTKPTPDTESSTTQKNPTDTKKPWKIEVDRGGGGGTSRQPTRTQQPKQGQKPTDPNAHKIDWGKVK